MKQERENEKELWEEAKKLQEQERYEVFIYKVRGLPWARKIVRIRDYEEVMADM